MGCVASRPVMMPQRLEPLFFRKLEEIKGLTTLSKKQLLNDGVEDEHSTPISNNENDRRRGASYETEGSSAKEVLSNVEEDEHSIPNFHNENDQSASPENEGPANVALALAEDDEHSRPSSNNENNQIRASSESEGPANATPEPQQLENIVPEGVVEAVMAVIEKMATGETDAEGDDEEEAGVICIDGALLSPGSPSFRVYCMDTLENEEDDKNEDGIKTEDSLASNIVEPSNSREGTVAEKKQRKGRKFRTVLPKGKPVKNLLKVKSCYYPACGRSQGDSPLKAVKEPLLDDNR